MSENVAISWIEDGIQRILDPVEIGMVVWDTKGELRLMLRDAEPWQEDEITIVGPDAERIFRELVGPDAERIFRELN